MSTVITLNDLYGTDKAHYKDYLCTAAGDTATDSGESNLQNALFRRLITVQGSIVHLPGYGVGILQYEGILNSLSNQRRLAATIGEQFPQDPRVQSVDSVSFTIDPNNAEMTTILVTITPIGQNQLVMKFTPFGGN